MHEFSVCQSLLRQVEKLAQEQRAHQVSSIRVKVGPLSGVVPELLRQAFPLVSAGSVAESAELQLEALPVVVRCTSCGAETEARPNRLVCGECGDYRTKLVSGDELLLASVELWREPRRQLN